MINLRKLNSLKLRMPKPGDKIVGPNFKRSKPSEIVISGSKITFTAPIHSPYSESTALQSKRNDVIDAPFRSFTSGLLAVDSWETTSVFSRRWGFYYHMFGGLAGELGMHIGIRKRKDRYEFKSGTFFHPKNFEYVLGLYLTNFYGWKTLKGKACYQGPVDWVVNKSFEIPAASFDVLGSNEMRAFVFPITDMHFVEVSFYYTGREVNVRESMRALVNQIIESMSLELSPDTERMVKQIKQESPGIELTENFAPLKWPVAKEDVEKDEGLSSELLS